LDEPSEIFAVMRTAIGGSPPLRAEVERSLLALLDRVNPSHRGSRFTVGTYVEWVIAALLFHLKVLSFPAGHGEDNTDIKDLLDQQRALFSIKSSFTVGGRPTRMKNLDGANSWTWTESTLFIGPGLGGIVLVVPAEFPALASAVTRVDGGYDLDHRIVLEHARAHPENFIPLQVPVNEGKASFDVATAFAKEMLTSGGYPHLSEVFRAYEELRAQSPTTRRLLAMIGEAVASGDIDERTALTLVRKLGE